MSQSSKSFKLSSDRRALLEALLEAEGLDAPSQQRIPRRTDDDFIPLSFAQQRLWFFDQLEPGSPTYNIPAAIRLSGPLDLAALEQSLNAIVSRHETMRTTFAAAKGQAIQVIAPELKLPLPVIDLQELPEETRETEARRLMGEEARQPFDLERGPLLRSSVLRLAESEHILLLTMHHIISDGWSTGVLVREVAQLYSAFTAGQQHPEGSRLPELPIQYADYAIWQRDWLAQGAPGDVFDKELSYWTGKLGGSLPVLELPGDFQRPAVQTLNGAQLSFQLPSDLSAQLRALSRQEDSTLFQTMLTAFKVLLHRYTHQTDLLVGTPIANRTRAEIQDLIGFFVNTLVLRTDLSGNPSFRDALRRVREVSLEAYAHQDMPFEKLVEVLQPERDLSHTPLFQVTFVLENAPLPNMDMAGLKLSQLTTESGTAKFDLTMFLWDETDKISGSIEYNTDLFEPATIARMAGHFQALVAGIVANPDERIAYLPLLTAAEQQQSLIEWNRSEAEYPRDAAVHQLIEAQAERNPQAAAIIFEGASLTYAELNARANQLAHYLRMQGVGPDVLVALCVERSLEMIVGMLAILKAGGAYVPLDPAYPADRLQYMLSHSQARVVLTQDRLVENLPLEGTRHQAQVFRLDADWDTLAEQPTTNLPRLVLPDHLAYIIFTSGSTGRPKGVMVKQQGLINLVHGLRAYFDDPAVQITGLITSISFDISVNQIFPTLIFGRALHIIPDPVKFNSWALVRYLDEHQIHLLDAVPSYLQAVLNEVAPEQPANALRYLLIGGEKIEQRLLQSVFGQFGAAVEIINIYGLTEISDINILGPIRAADVGQPITAGKPLQNNRIYLLDQYNQPQPIGIAGEICVSGESVSRGYLFRPELTAERFVACPFEDGQLMVRTGDLGRWRPDGTVEILGRIDQQVKVRGFRIETGEIEAVLAKHPSVNECVVVVREDASPTGGQPDKRLVGYLAPREGIAAPTSSELRQLLGAQLPEYMVPAAFVTLPALPKTPNGKIDRKALPVPELQSELDASFVPPTTPIEELLAQIWADVLGVERLGTRSNFFDLGGHSLLGTQIVSRIREAFGVELPLRVTFEAPTVVELAARIEAARGTPTTQQAPPIQPVDWSGPLPLSFAQQRLWLLDQFEPNTATYNIPAAVRLRGTLDLAALERTLTAIIERQTSLRTTFKSVDGQSVQVVGPVPFLPLPLIDLRSLPETTRETEAQRMTNEEALRPFDLEYGPLCRFTVLRLDDQDHMLLVTMHHIVSDGWSISVFVRELTALYTAFVNNQASPLAELPVQYTDYAIWQRQWLQGSVLEQQLSYWKRRLAGTPPVLELPTDWPRPAVRTFDGASIHVSLSADLSGQLRALSRREGTTLFMTLLAAFKVLLSRSASQEDIVVGTPIAGRNRAETENLIGFFLNTLVLRTDMSGEPTFKELLGRVRETTLDAYAHQDVPFEKLLDELHPERDLSYTPLFQVFFNMLNLPDMRVELPNLTAEALASAEIGSKFDLTLYAQEQSETIDLTLVYNANLFRETRMQELIAQFQLLLGQIATTPSAPIVRYSLVTPGAQPLLPNPAEPLDTTWYGAVHTLFAQQAERSPDRVALIDPLGSWSYAELNGRANQIAHYLIRGGIQPEAVVAIYSYRSAALVCAILGVLKAGAAYTILDPAYPTSRLIDYLQVAQPRGWIQLESAGQVPEALAQFMDTQGYCCRLELPHALQTAAQPELDAQPTSEPGVEVGPDNAAIIGFTSGSTGKPKGIVARHGPLTHFLPWLQHTFGLNETDRYSMISGLAHDPLQRDMFTPLCSGATVCVPLPEEIVTPGRLAEWMKQHMITIAHLTPALGQLLTETTAESHNGDHQIPSLRYAFIVGDVLTMRDVARIRSLAPGVTCVNFYGSTETQRAVGYYLIPASDDRPQTATTEQVRSKEILPLGRGMKDVQVLVLTASQQIAGIGEVGEIYMRSPHLARGYIGDEKLTGERFLSNPFTSIHDDRLYRTGDLGRYRPDGNVEFVGRADHQVKIRGFRIELGEIEAVLGQHETVREAVTIAREDTSPAGGHPNKRLVAYIVGQPGTTPVIADLRRFLQERLPNYMIPAAFVLLEALPLTPNGKVDRRALPKPDGAHRDADAAYVAPETQLEQTIAAIWQEVLQIEMAGVDDNFFDIGGSSIHVVQVHSKLREQLDRDVPIIDMFKYPTIGSLAKHLSQDQPEQASFQDIHERARKQKAAMERKKQLRSRS